MATILRRSGIDPQREAYGVKFEQATGGAIGFAASAKAEKIAAEANFFVGEAETEAEFELKELTIEDVKGIGPATAKELASAGISTLKELVEADSSAITGAAGTSTEIALDWGVQASELIARFDEQNTGDAK